MKQSDFPRMAVSVLGILACIGVIYIIGKSMVGEWKYESRETLQKYTEEMYMPGLAYMKEGPKPTAAEWIKERAYSWLPLVKYVEQKEPYESVMEDEETIAKILAAQANDENMVDENGNLVGESTPVQEEPVIPQGQSSIDMSIEKLRDFNYLLTNFYTVDSTTMIGPEQLNVDDLLGRNMKIDKSTKGAKVLIFHSHSQETFVDSVPGDASTSIVGVGEYLTQLLNQKGIETIHDTGVYDIINGQLDRSNAYENAEASVRPMLDANPTIEVAIDLHRDGVNQDTHLVTEVNGKPTARIMYFNGLSRTRMNGDIAYLNNPYIQDNLAFSLQMELASENKYPGFARRIYLAGYRYNLHLLPKSLLIEAGAQTNTVGEMMNAMEVLADVLSNVVTE
ncbi:stage II sporulation protein P [Muricomes intestini]|uniref:stage II sporulation protein P n=1 Tax=Muricomes intestini TaxID=1796634 RepID=UPI003A5C830B